MEYNFTYREIENGYIVEADEGYKIELNNTRLKNPLVRRAVLKSIEGIETVKISEVTE